MGCVGEVPDAVMSSPVSEHAVCVVVNLAAFLLCAVFCDYFYFILSLYSGKHFENVSLCGGTK